MFTTQSEVSFITTYAPFILFYLPHPGFGSFFVSAWCLQDTMLFRLLEIFQVKSVRLSTAQGKDGNTPKTIVLPCGMESMSLQPTSLVIDYAHDLAVYALIQRMVR